MSRPRNGNYSYILERTNNFIILCEGGNSSQSIIYKIKSIRYVYFVNTVVVMVISNHRVLKSKSTNFIAAIDQHMWYMHCQIKILLHLYICKVYHCRIRKCTWTIYNLTAVVDLHHNIKVNGKICKHNKFQTMHRLQKPYKVSFYVYSACVFSLTYNHYQYYFFIWNILIFHFVK